MLGLIFNVILLAIVVRMLIWLGDCIRWPVLSWLGHIVFLMLFFAPLNFLREALFGPNLINFLVWHFSKPVMVLMGLALSLGAIVFHRRLIQVTQLLLLVSLPFVLVTFGRASWKLFRWPPPIYAASLMSSRQLGRPVSPGPKVLWMIFDELDYRVAFEQRPATLHLPGFDRLLSESFQATNAYPPSNSTLLSLPSLLLGRRITEARPDGPNELQVRTADRPDEVGWSRQTNLFDRLSASGWQTALIGWTHPYPRLFGDRLRYCSFYPCFSLAQARGEPLWQSMAIQIWTLCQPLSQRRLHRATCEQYLREVEEMLSQQLVHLTILHLPLPHTPGVYDSRRKILTNWNFTEHKGYFANLQLVDGILERLRAELESTGSWRQTTVIISSDHYWRLSRRYDSKIDHRVPFIIKLAGKTEAGIIPNTFNTVLTADLIEAIMGGQVKDGDSLRVWFNRQPVHAADSIPIFGMPE